MPTPPASSRVTLTDIAAACGLSRATVSLVLRGSPLVSPRTRARVEAEIQRQGYVYHRGAANLRRKASNTVALVINDLSNPFFAEFAAGVDETLAEAGHVTLLGSTGESVERQQTVLASLLEHAPAGLILSPAEGSDADRLRTLLRPGLPVLVFNRELEGRDARNGWDYLGLDNVRGARLATEHLLALGHRRIAFFGGHRDSSSCAQRRRGYHEALADAGIVPEPHWLVESAPTRLEAAGQTGALFLRDPAPTAAVCYNDAVALGLVAGLARRGRRAGEDFAVTGFDDIPEAAASFPPLTTVSVDPRARGHEAATMILQRLDAPAGAPFAHVSPARLLCRASSDVRPADLSPPRATP
ncbi:LacI family DNA-binding transcriptional regulator [Marilutibacter spongiae]|uniref:LacI family DNA-binding transcriptional regulator n=1 Tax=Marilutibacter spongiae TaxID=2025720 RepID=A0A7W3TM11_9GAMM|nr:LacI family DNA-binding transcriptional regulator [Lysobacter spongiae]MBB1060813.1 LacI family DNA-binding transcriptional regulator [Lysobacter spongiae]